jgi:hypothetical protein
MKLYFLDIELDLWDLDNILQINSFYIPFGEKKPSQRTLTIKYELVKDLMSLDREYSLRHNALYWEIKEKKGERIFEVYTGRKARERLYRVHLKNLHYAIEIKIPENVLTFQQRYPEYFKGINIPDPFVPFLGNILFSEILYYLGGFLLHAAAIEYRKNYAYIFVGSSGMGKTTIAKLCQKKGLQVLGDDIVGIRREGNNFYVYPVPWGNSLDGNRMNRRSRLDKVFFLSKSKDGKNKLEFINKKVAMNEMIRCSLLPYWDKRLVNIELELIHQLLETVPSFRLIFHPEDSLNFFIKK